MDDKMIRLDLRLFAETPVNTTGSGGMSAEMKTYYSRYLIENAKPKLVHDQFGQKHNIPKNGGKTIEFRRYAPLAKATTPLTEGVTPKGQTLTVTTVPAEVRQYGGFVPLTDMLLLTAIDNNLVQALSLLETRPEQPWTRSPGKSWQAEPTCSMRRARWTADPH